MTTTRKVRAPASANDKELPAELLARVRGIWERSRTQAARSVNTAHVCANWLTGQQIVEAEQGGARRAGYGQALLKNLAHRLTAEFGSGFSLTALKHMRGFHLTYPTLLGQKSHALRDLLLGRPATRKGHAARDLSAPDTPDPAAWKPGVLHPALSWTHYRALLKVSRQQTRDFVPDARTRRIAPRRMHVQFAKGLGTP